MTFDDAKARPAKRHAGLLIDVSVRNMDVSYGGVGGTGVAGSKGTA